MDDGRERPVETVRLEPRDDHDRTKKKYYSWSRVVRRHVTIKVEIVE